MKKIIKHMYSADGYYLGSKEVSFWHQWFNLPVICVVLLSVLIGLGVVFALNGQEMFNRSNRPPISITNDLPF